MNTIEQAREMSSEMTAGFDYPRKEIICVIDALIAELAALKAALQERDAEIERLTSMPLASDAVRSVVYGKKIDAQRKVLEQVKAVLLDVAESINLKRVWKDSDGQRMDEAVDAAITAIQEQLK